MFYKKSYLSASTHFRFPGIISALLLSDFMFPAKTFLSGAALLHKSWRETVI